MEAYEVDLNKYMDKNERIERSLMAFEDEVFDDVKALNEMELEIERLQEIYDEKLDELQRMARNYGDAGYDFREELQSLMEQL